MGLATVNGHHIFRSPIHRQFTEPVHEPFFFDHGQVAFTALFFASIVVPVMGL